MNLAEELLRTGWVPARRKKGRPGRPYSRRRWCKGITRRCRWCKVELTQSDNGRQRFTDYTRDHVIPKSLGGRQTVASCYRCNQVRGIEAALLVGNYSAAAGLAKVVGLPPPGHHVEGFYADLGRRHLDVPDVPVGERGVAETLPQLSEAAELI